MQKFTAAQLLLTKQIMELAEVIANNIIDAIHPQHSRITYTLHNPVFSVVTNDIIFDLTSEEYYHGETERDCHDSIVVRLEDLNDSEAAVQRAIEENDRKKQEAKEAALRHEAAVRQAKLRHEAPVRQAKIDTQVAATKKSLEELNIEITPEIMAAMIETATQAVDK